MFSRSSCQADEAFGRRTPWDSIYKLEAVVNKSGKDGQKAEKMEWILAMINDAVVNKVVGPGELSISALTGKGRGNGNKGFIDVILFLRELRVRLLGEVLETSTLPLHAKETLREKLGTAASYRRAVGAPFILKGVIQNESADAAQKTDISWLSTLGSGGRELFTFIEAMGQRQSSRYCSLLLCRIGEGVEMSHGAGWLSE